MSSAELAPSLPGVYLEQITANLRGQAEEAALEMSSKFDVDKKDFSIIRSRDEEFDPLLVVVYSARRGIDLGDESRSWEDIRGKRAKESDFLVTVGNDVVDTRKAMTEATYSAMVNQHNGASQLPDHWYTDPDIHQFVFPKTWLTGESAIRHYALTATLRSDSIPELAEVDTAWRERSFNGPLVGFRPGVILDEERI